MLYDMTESSVVRQSFFHVIYIQFSLGNEINEMKSAQLQNKWPCNYDRYLAFNKVTINGK